METSGYHRLARSLAETQSCPVARIEYLFHTDEDHVVAVILRIGAGRDQIGYVIRGNPVQ
jgi:hypothetical protein